MRSIILSISLVLSILMMGCAPQPKPEVTRCDCMVEHTVPPPSTAAPHPA